MSAEFGIVQNRNSFSSAVPVDMSMRSLTLSTCAQGARQFATESCIAIIYDVICIHLLRSISHKDQAKFSRCDLTFPKRAAKVFLSNDCKRSFECFASLYTAKAVYNMQTVNYGLYGGVSYIFEFNNF